MLDCHSLDDLREPLKDSFHFQELFEQYNFDDFIEYYDMEECEEEHELDEKFEHEWIERSNRSKPRVVESQVKANNNADQKVLAKSVS